MCSQNRKISSSISTLARLSVRQFFCNKKKFVFNVAPHTPNIFSLLLSALRVSCVFNRLKETKPRNIFLLAVAALAMCAVCSCLCEVTASRKKLWSKKFYHNISLSSLVASSVCFSRRPRVRSSIVLNIKNYIYAGRWRVSIRNE